jgi:hypothetical protein
MSKKITQNQLKELFKFYGIDETTALNFFKNVGSDSIQEILEILL